MNRDDVLQYVKEAYGTEPEYLFKSSPDTVVLRHELGKKWYGVILPVSGKRFDLEAEEVEVLNVKADPELVSFLRMQPGMFPAYHMNKEHWISILLDGTVQEEKIRALIDGSYELTAKIRARHLDRRG